MPVRRTVTKEIKKKETKEQKAEEEERETEIIPNSQLPFEQRDHSLFVGFAPYVNPKIAISVVIEHGGSGSSTAAPIAAKVFKKII